MTNLAGLLGFIYGWGLGLVSFLMHLNFEVAEADNRLFIYGLTRFHGRYRNGLKITRVYKSLGQVVNRNWAQQYFNPLKDAFLWKFCGIPKVYLCYANFIV